MLGMKNGRSVRIVAYVFILGCLCGFFSCKKADRPKIQLPDVQGKTIYLVPIGDFSDSQVDHLVGYYREKYKLEIKILKPIRMSPKVWDPARQQALAEPLVDYMREAVPEQSNDPDAILIGLTTTDMYPTSMNWRFAFGWRKADLHAAVVSSARMNLHYFLQPLDANPETRLRKMVTKDIGILYYQLPQSDDPRSVLYQKILGIQELDAASEDF